MEYEYPHGSAPNEEELLYHTEIVQPIAYQQFWRALVIIQPDSKNGAYVRYMCEEVDDAIDLLHHALIQLHELRRQENENRPGEPEDDGA